MDQNAGRRVRGHIIKMVRLIGAKKTLSARYTRWELDYELNDIVTCRLAMLKVTVIITPYTH